MIERPRSQAPAVRTAGCSRHVALGVIAAALTFIPVYRQIPETDAESWVAYFLAFQNVFFWEAALSAVMKQFTA